AVVDDLAACDEADRSCEQIAPFALDATAITMGTPRPATPDGVMDVAEQSWTGQFGGRYGNLRVHDIASATGAILRTVTGASTPAMRSSATAADGSYWLAYSRYGFPAEPAYIEHRSRNGDLLCADVGWEFISLAIDTTGDVWGVHPGEDGEPFPYWLRKYSGSKVGPVQDGVPTCSRI